jgi:hypothetical protein
MLINDFRGGGPIRSLRAEKNSFRRPWLHFLEAFHPSGHGFPAGFLRRRRSRRDAFGCGSGRLQLAGNNFEPPGQLVSGSAVTLGLL